MPVNPHQVNRNIGKRFVQLLSVGKRLVFPKVLIPTSSPQPRRIRIFRPECLKSFDYFGKRFRAGEVGLSKCFCETHKMGMCIVETGVDGLSSRIDRFLSLICRADFFGGTHGNKPAVSYGKCFSGGKG